nr:cysteine--tRNA ligase [Candidatus Njordarchaeum guaymaensis]
MVLKVYNSLTGELEEFRPFEDKKVRLYVCGLTVYDYAHIGHARTYIAFDIIKRYLKYRGYNVLHVQNITDVDDKIIARASERGVDPFKFASEFARDAQNDLDSLGVERADIYPRVTEHIKDIITLIEKLIKNGHAYQVNGDVYFSVEKFKKYGRLSHQSPSEVLAGARVEVDEKKRNPADFALWKSAKKGELSFKSPWGMGRPGWHIECSTMSMKYLGDGFEIHGGGKDLVFPHHENEIAQSEAATGKEPFVKYWLHTGFLNVSGEKMSKSLGNYVTIKDVLSRWDPDVFRLFVASAHYRSPIDFSEEVLEQSKKNLARIRSAVDDLENQVEKLEKEQQGETHHPARGDAGISSEANEIEKRFIEAMDNDFNTPQALVAFQDLAKLGSKALSVGAGIDTLRSILVKLRSLAGVIGLSKVSSREVEKKEELPEEASKLINEREEARRNKNWKKADEIRERLGKMGIVIEDTAEGTKWRFVSNSSTS